MGDLRGTMSSKALDLFAATMTKRYQVSNLVDMKPAEFRQAINDLLNLRDASMEGYKDADKQRDLSIRYHWGHNHDFGDFSLQGRMGNRHVSIPAQFADQFKALPTDLMGKKILDIGVWTGGTSLLFSALGAEVVAVEEVKKYADTVEFLKKAFGLKGLKVLNCSLYELNRDDLYDQFDYVFFSGVIYHVTDPIIALRIVFNCLKDGGTCLLESTAIPDKRRLFGEKDKLVSYEGPGKVWSGAKEDLSRGGWDWFVPSPSAVKQMMIDVGFENIEVGPIEETRVMAVGHRTKHCDILRAGLSVRNIR